MSRIDTTPVDILTWILSTLRSELALSESTCFLATSDLAPARIPSSSTFVTVTPSAGEFVIPEQSVGNVTEKWGFRVRVYLRVVRDRAGHDEVRLLDPENGMFAWKRKVLKALCGKDVSTWNLRGTIAAAASTPLVWLRGERGELDFASFAVDFAADFDWDLS